MVAVEGDPSCERFIGFLVLGLRDKGIVRFRRRNWLVDTAGISHREEAPFRALFETHAAESRGVVHDPLGGVIVGQQCPTNGEVIIDRVQVPADIAIGIGPHATRDSAFLDLPAQKNHDFPIWLRLANRLDRPVEHTDITVTYKAVTAAASDTAKKPP